MDITYKIREIFSRINCLFGKHEWGGAAGTGWGRYYTYVCCWHCGKQKEGTYKVTGTYEVDMNEIEKIENLYKTGQVELSINDLKEIENIKFKKLNHKFKNLKITKYTLKRLLNNLKREDFKLKSLKLERFMGIVSMTKLS